MQHIRDIFNDKEITGVPAIAYYADELQHCQFGDTYGAFVDFPAAHGWRVAPGYLLTPARTIGCCEMKPYPFLQAWIFFQLARSFFKVGEKTAIDPELIGDLSLDTTGLKEALQRWHQNILDLHSNQPLEAVQKLSEANEMIVLARGVILANVAEQPALLAETMGLKKTGKSCGRSPFVDPVKGVPDAAEMEEILCLMVFGETLSASLLHAIHACGLDFSGWQDDGDTGWGPPSYISYMWQEDQWCLRSQKVLKGKLGQSALLLWAILRNHTNNKHVRHPHPSSAKCSREECLFIEAASQFADPTNPRYQPAHRCGNPEACRNIGPDEGRIFRALENGTNDQKDGTFPLLRISRQNGVLDIEVKEWESQDSFATISHVWSQGLGNPSANSIPVCQLESIEECLDKLFGDEHGPERSGRKHCKGSKQGHLFWLDTLAIPHTGEHGTMAIEPEGLTRSDLKKRAINRINHVFKQAKHCIVIDQHLVTNGRINHNCGTVAIALLSSGWMMRLWTLQEAFDSQSRKVLVSGRKKLLCLELLRTARSSKSTMRWTIESTILQKLDDNMMKNPRHMSFQNSGALLIANAWRAARYRTIERLADETQVLSSLLNIPIPQRPDDLEPGNYRLQQVSVSGVLRREELMAEFWRLIRADDRFKSCMPAGIIFLPGRRLSIEGFRWAPLSWMCHEDEPYPFPLNHQNFVLGLDHRGVLARYPGFRLHGSEKTLDAILDFDNNEPFVFSISGELSEWYEVKRVEENNDNQTKSVGFAADQCRFWMERLRHQLRDTHRLRLAIVLSRPRPVETPAEIGLLVELEGTRREGQVEVQIAPDTEVFYSKIICRVHISHLPLYKLEGGKNYASMSMHPGETFLRRFSKFGQVGLMAVTVEPAQKWCIDGYGQGVDGIDVASEKKTQWSQAGVSAKASSSNEPDNMEHNQENIAQRQEDAPENMEGGADGRIGVQEGSANVERGARAVHEAVKDSQAFAGDNELWIEERDHGSNTDNGSGLPGGHKEQESLPSSPVDEAQTGRLGSSIARIKDVWYSLVVPR